MTDSVTFYGLSYAAGNLVSVSVAGLDCGDYVVSSTGSVTVPFGSDPDGLFTFGWLLTQNGTGKTVIQTTISGITYTASVAVQIGYSYVSQGQTLRPALEQDIKSQTGQGISKLRRVHRVGTQLEATQGISFGTRFSSMIDVTFAQSPLIVPDNPYTFAQLFTGVWSLAIEDDDGYEGQVCWQIDRPYPAKVLAVSAFLETSEP